MAAMSLKGIGAGSKVGCALEAGTTTLMLDSAPSGQARMQASQWSHKPSSMAA